MPQTNPSLPAEQRLWLPHGDQVALHHRDPWVVQVDITSTQQQVLTFELCWDSPVSLRLEVFHPETDHPRWPQLVGQLITALRPQLDCHYLIGLYPCSWHPVLELCGFQFIRKRVRMEINLPISHRPRASPKSYTIQPLTAVAEQLGGLLQRSEPTQVSLEDCVTLCDILIRGDFGPIIQGASVDLLIDQQVVGACIFTEYRGTPLLAHLFLEREYQRQGLATVMLTTCLRQLADLAYTQATLSTDLANHQACQLYTNLGFVPINPTLACSYFLLHA